MPQAPDALRALFDHDGEAWLVLHENFTDTRGVIRPKAGHVVTVAEAAAIDYLVLEWDYAYEAAAPQPDLTPPEILASRLIDAWCGAHGGQIPWAKAVEITAIVTKLSDEERLRLLALGDSA
jgi:hypothetical protein